MSNSGDFIEFLDEGTITVVEVTEDPTLELFDAGPGVAAGLSSENLSFTYTGPLVLGIGTIKYPIAGGTFIILSVAAVLTSAPSGGSTIIDVNKNGVSIYGDQSSRPTFLDGQYSSVIGSHSVSQLANGDYVTVDIDQVAPTPGTTLVVVIRKQRIA